MYSSTIEFYDIIYRSKNYGKESMILHDYIQSRKPEARTILDVACGTGRHMEYLNRYYQVDGLDINEEFLKIAKQRNPSSKFWVADMTNFKINQKFDVIVCLFSSIGFVKTLDKVKHTVHQFMKHLTDRGLIIIEPWFTPDQWIPGYISVLHEEAGGYKVLRMSHAELDGTLSISNERYLIGSKDGIIHLEERHVLGLFTHEELTNIFYDLGLVIEYDPQGICGKGTYILSLR